MPQEVETMMCVGTKPRHGLGKEIPEDRKLTIPRENTLNSLWFGESAELNKKALRTALAMAA